jgi:hypothetical protein
MLCPSEVIREPAAEMLGTMIFTLVGCGGNCQAVLSANTGVASSPKGDPLSSSLGWACGQSLTTLMFYCTPDKGSRHRYRLGCLGQRRYHWRSHESRGMSLPCVILFPVLRRTESFCIDNSMHGCL